MKRALIGSLMTLLQLFLVSGLPTKLEVSIHESPDTSSSENLEAVQHEVQGRSRGNNFKMEITSKNWEKMYSFYNNFETYVHFLRKTFFLEKEYNFLKL